VTGEYNGKEIRLYIQQIQQYYYTSAVAANIKGKKTFDKKEMELM
jgi:hypothetical protein